MYSLIQGSNVANIDKDADGTRNKWDPLGTDTAGNAIRSPVIHTGRYEVTYIYGEDNTEFWVQLSLIIAIGVIGIILLIVVTVRFGSKIDDVITGADGGMNGRRLA